MRRELELKFSIPNDKEFINLLKTKKIFFSDPITQRDAIFFRKGKGFCDLKEGEPVIRIRNQEGKYITTLKKYVHGITDRVEVECEILDAEAFQRYLELLDLDLVVTVKKIREKTFYKNAVVCLDHVEGLGVFVEVEIVSDECNAEDDMKKLNQIVEELCLNKKNIVKMPYDEMLFNKERGM